MAIVETVLFCLTSSQSS